MYTEQHDSLRKQLEQKVQINSLAEEINKSSGDIGSLVSRLSTKHEGALKRREDDLAIRNNALADRRRQLASKKLEIEQRRRKLQNENTEMAERERENTSEFEAEK